MKMKQVKTKDVRTVVSKDKDSTFVSHTVIREADDDLDTVKKIDRETEYSLNRPYPTLPKSANPDDPPQHT